MKDEEIRLVSVEGENIRNLSTIAVRLDGEAGLFRVTGDNEEGKSTFLDIVGMFFGGKKAVKASTIQEGKDGAWIRGTLNNGYSIGLKFTASAPNGYLTVTTPDDAIQKAPQALLDGWGGPRSFDPGALLKKRIGEIEAIILGLAKDPDLKEKREAIASKRTALRDDRRPLNSQKQRAERTPRPEGDRPEAVDVSGEMEALQELQEAQDRRTASLQQAEKKGQEAEKYLDEEDRIRGEIENLEFAIRDKKNFAEEASSKARDALMESENIAAAVDGTYPDRTEEVAVAQGRISEADEINRALEPWKEYDRAQVEAKAAGKNAAKLTKAIKALDAEEEELLKAAEIPVRGISFDEDGGMLLDDHPIEVNSGMRKLDMAYDMGVAANSQIKICLMDEANDYGLAALKKLRDRAVGDGVQVIAARLTDNGGHGEIIVKDGKAVTP